MAQYKRKDHLHQRAKKEGLRSRAAYKLEEVQKTSKLLKAGDRVFDLGCWPGGWLEVAGKWVGKSGRVVGVDRAKVDPEIPLSQVSALVGDLEDAAIAEQLREGLGSSRADVVLSDAAPKLTGIRETDCANVERLLEAIEALLPELLAPGGSLLIKILDGPEAAVVVRRIRQAFDSGKTTKLKSTRKGSTESYLLARGFKGATPAIR